MSWWGSKPKLIAFSVNTSRRKHQHKPFEIWS
jgi:hypothetical protein